MVANAVEGTQDVQISENEYRVIGPPGTGKTTWLCRQVESAVNAYCERSGRLPCESRDVLLSSLTKAAAHEIHNRSLDIPSEQVGTLHAHAFRALGKPNLCVSAGAIKEWNDWCSEKGKHSLRFSSELEKAPDQSRATARVQEGGRGDALLATYHRLRAELCPKEKWTEDKQAFAKAYEEWKSENDYMDFSDIIDNAYYNTSTAPGLPSIIMVDEAQDHSRAELRLIRKWAKSCDKLIVVGDPDQNLYEWRGAQPEAFYEVPIPKENHRVLSQSHRVPRAVHAAAVKMIDRIRNRVPVAYQPRNEPGAVKRSPESITDRRANYAFDEAQKYLANGKTVMFLASCEYMLSPIIHVLRDNGIPYWNPFARDRGYFNPLTPSKGVSSMQRLLDYLLPQSKFYGDRARLWTWPELNSWIEVCRADRLLKRGVKALIARRSKDDDSYLDPHDVAALFEERAIAAMDRHCLMFFKAAVEKKRKGVIDFSIKILQKHGMETLESKPKVVVGTIHSVKGGEADVVFLSPDLSLQGHTQFCSEKGRPAIYRQFYVGMTRAKETLILCESGNKRCISW